MSLCIYEDREIHYYKTRKTAKSHYYINGNRMVILILYNFNRNERNSKKQKELNIK